MPADPLRHVRPGEPFGNPPAAAWNAFVDAAKAHQQNEFNRLAGGLSTFLGTDIIRVKNESGANRNQFDVLGLNGPIFDPTNTSIVAFLQEVTFRGIVPDETHYGRFAILLEPVPAGNVARALLSGVGIAWVDVVEADHHFADITEGNATKLTSTGGGSVQILWKESDGAYYGYDTGEMWAIVRMGKRSGLTHFLAPPGGIPARTGTGPYTPGSAVCDILLPAGGGDLAFTGSERIYNDSDFDVTGDAEGWAAPGADGRLYMIQEYCPPYY